MCLLLCVCVHRYQHSRQLVQALNRFVQHDAEMPEGWEKKLNKEGKVSFSYGCIVHGNRNSVHYTSGVFHRPCSSTNFIH